MNEHTIAIAIAAAVTFGVVLAAIETFLRWDRRRAERARARAERRGLAGMGPRPAGSVRAAARMESSPQRARTAGVSGDLGDYAADFEESPLFEHGVRRI